MSAKTFAVTILFLFTQLFANSQECIFKNGDRVCFIGSSLTMNGGCYHFTNLFYATRYPGIDLTFFNCGISGEVTDQILRRIDSDILSHHPTWCVLMLEENDLKPSLYFERRNDPETLALREQAVEHWKSNAELIVQKLVAGGAKVILQTPTVYDQSAKLPARSAFGVNDSLAVCVEHLKLLSKKYHLPIVDAWTVLNDVNNQLQSKDSTLTIIGHDRMHAGNMGHFVVTNEFLKIQQPLPYVAQVMIDSKSRNHCFNCSLTKFHAGSRDMTFQYLSKSLPFPDPVNVQPDSFFNFTDNMNAELLQVKNLPDGHYHILIDSNSAGVFTSKDLSAGINLSRIHNTPQYIQATGVLNIFNDFWKNEATLRTISYVEYQHDAHLRTIKDPARLRTYLDSLLDLHKDNADGNFEFFRKMFNVYYENKPKEVKLWDDALALLEKIRVYSKPSSHRFTIRKIETIASGR